MEDSDQSVHPHRLMRDLSRRSMGFQGSISSSDGKLRLIRMYGSCADPEGDRGSDPAPLENHKAIGFLSNTGQDPMENHIDINSAFNVGPLST